MHAGLGSGASGSRSWPAAIGASIEMTDEGLVFGAGSILARMAKDAGAADRLALDADRDRLVALLSAATGRPVAADGVLRHVEAAAGHWQRGDKALANLRLVFADLPRLSDPDDAYRLCLAEHLLDEGMAPAALMEELGFAVPELGKYNRDEPRVRAGSPDGGQWTFGPGGSPASRRSERPNTTAVASEGGPPEDKKTYDERRALDETTPDEDVAHGGDMLHLDTLPRGVGPGPYAGRSVPAGPGPRPTPQKKDEVTVIGRETGCHTCGTKDPGTSDGRFYCDHQDPTALNPPGSPQVYYPHCRSCSCAQGGHITNYLRGRR